MWIESHEELGEHPKMYAFADALGICEAQAIGHLQYLWWWCLRYARDGEIRGNARTIARAVKWTNDADVLLAALEQAGWLEPIDGGWHVHDWHDYAGRLIERRRTEAERLRRWRERGRKADETRTSVVTVPNLTVPSLHEEKNHGGAEENATVRSDERAHSESASVPLKKARPKKAAKVWPQDEHAIALEEACGATPETQREIEAWLVGYGELKHMPPSGATPDGIRARGAEWYRRYPEIPLTPITLSKHYGELARPLSRSPNGSGDERGVAAVEGWLERKRAQRASGGLDESAHGGLPGFEVVGSDAGPVRLLPASTAV